MPRIRIPWKLLQLAKALIGEDWVYNRATFHPDFSERAFTQLSDGRFCSRHDSRDPEDSKKRIVERFLHRSDAEFLVPVDSVIALADDVRLNNPIWKESILNAASEICEVGLPVYHLKRSPLTGSFPWKKLVKGPYGDPLFVSRPQRFGFAPVLAQAAVFDPKYVELLDDILQGWQRYAQESRFRWPYNSSHAVVYRVIALCFCWTFIGAINKHGGKPESTSVLFRILSILRNDILFLAPHLGKAKPNNHLLADYFVGWLLQSTFPELIPDSMDFSVYEEKWQQELLRQFYTDGGCFEHAIHYQEHGCEMAVIYLLKKGRKSIPCDVEHRIGKILKFQAGLNGPLCRPWAIGDTTEDTLLPLDESLGWSSIATLAVNNALYPEQAMFSSVKQPDQKAFWLLAGKTESLQSNGPQGLHMEDYPDGGFVHWIDPEQHSEILFRTGVAPDRDFIPGHMHADVLSLFWRVNGIDILSASGTYTYKFNRNDVENEREYFCGPWSHSCIVIEGEDPLGPMDGDFRRLDNGLRVVAETRGDPIVASLCIGEVRSSNRYQGLKRGVLNLPHQLTMIFDVLTESHSEMQVGAGWHFGKEVEIRCDGKIEATKEGLPIGSIVFSDEGILQCHKGTEFPMRGWQSDSYGVKTSTFYAHIVYPKRTRIFTHLLLPRVAPPGCSIECNKFHEDYATFKIDCDPGEYLVYVSLTPGRREFSIENLSITAKAIVYRKRRADTDTITLIDCSSIVGLAEAQSFEVDKPLQLNRNIDTEHWEIVR